MGWGLKTGLHQINLNKSEGPRFRVARRLVNFRGGVLVLLFSLTWRSAESVDGIISEAFM